MVTQNDVCMTRLSGPLWTHDIWRNSATYGREVLHIQETFSYPRLSVFCLKSDTVSPEPLDVPPTQEQL